MDNRVDSRTRQIPRDWLSQRFPPKQSLPPWYLALLLALLALIPRTLHLDDFFTVDESFHWVWRVMHFMNALAKERWAQTDLTGHPGVTTMWLGAVGRTIAFAVGLTGPEWYKGSVAYLALLRLPLALVNGAAVGVGYLALRRLVRPDTAFLAGVLWAGSPFLIAHSRLLHMDGLLTTFMTLSVLLLLCAAYDCPRMTTRCVLSLVASAVCAGLALLTKAPSLMLLPMAGGMLLLCSPVGGVWQRVQWVLLRYPFWLICAGIVFFAGWPAMWVAPQQAVGHIIAEVINNGGQPHESGNYFLGQPVDDPGWLFYPAVVVWRSSPFTLIGLLLLPLALWQSTTERRTLLMVGGYALLFGMAMDSLPKKFDRYLLPIFPLLDIVAAAGLVAALDWLQVRRIVRGLERALPLATAVVLLLINGWYHPYELAYFNPLVGGSATGQYVMLAGWGEGMEQVGAWLRTRPDLNRSPVISWDPRTLEPFVPVRVVELSELTLAQPASYAVVYSRGVQRQEEQAAIEQLRQTTPLYTVQQYGIVYAQVYQPIRPFDEPVDAMFGDGLRLRGIRHTLQGNELVITPSWSVEADQTGGLFCFVHVLDRRGKKVAQVDAPLDEGLFTTWQAGQQFGSPLPMNLPPDLPPGEYRVVLGVYYPAGGERLPLAHHHAIPESVDGPHVLLLLSLPHN